MKKTLWLALAGCLVAGFAYTNGTRLLASAEETVNDIPCAYSAVSAEAEEYADIVSYGATAATLLTVEEAKTKNIPEGYEDNVLVVEGDVSRGVLLDFSAYGIPTAVIESITFRIYVEENGKTTDDYPEVRIVQPYLRGWVMRYDISEQTDQWVDITLGADGTNMYKDVESLDGLGVDGVLARFELAIRNYGTNAAFYIDSIVIQEKKDDGVAPVITYNGETTLSIREGVKFAPDVSAFDVFENRNIEVEYVLDDGVEFDAKGSLPMGRYELTFKATDYYGNVATYPEKITLVVEEADSDLPIINVKTDTVYAAAGTIPVLNVTATDDNGEVEVTAVWSEGALDVYGALTEGEHTLTLEAKDPSGNTAVYTVTFYVTADGETGGVVVDEEALCPKCIVTFEGKNPETYRAGTKITKPADPPAKEATAEYFYEFEGWYDGDTLWDFENDVVQKDTDLTPCWQAQKQKYTVTFDGGSGVEYEYGVKIERPSDPQAPSGKTFVGWYVGLRKWDFDNDVVTENVELIARYRDAEGVGTSSSGNEDDEEEKTSFAGSGCGSIATVSFACPVLLCLGGLLKKYKKYKKK